MPAAVDVDDSATYKASLGECGCWVLNKAVRQGAEFDACVQVGRQRYKRTLAHTLDVTQNLSSLTDLLQ